MEFHRLLVNNSALCVLLFTENMHSSLLNIESLLTLALDF